MVESHSSDPLNKCYIPRALSILASQICLNMKYMRMLDKIISINYRYDEWCQHSFDPVPMGFCTRIGCRKKRMFGSALVADA